MDVNQRLVTFVLTAFGVSSLVGCSNFWDQIDEQHFVMRTRNDARFAWKHSQDAYCHLEHNLDDFERGFIDGYVAVATGGNGCPPSLPPRRYWKTKYSNPDCKGEVIAWFDGYQHGAAAAMGDGASNSRQILTSGEIYHKSKEHVEFHQDGESVQMKESYPEILAPLPEPFVPDGQSQPVPGVKEKVVPPTPPAKPYTPAEAKKTK